jgi:hypothetical protein
LSLLCWAIILVPACRNFAQVSRSKGRLAERARLQLAN